MEKDTFINVTSWLAAKCRESAKIGDCFYKTEHTDNRCPLKVRCCNVTPQDWEKELMKYGPAYVPIPPFMEDNPKPTGFSKAMFCKLVDKNKVEVCFGLVLDINANPDADDFHYSKENCNKALIRSFRNRLAEKLPGCASKTDEQIKDLIDVLIAFEGYSLDWGYCGWEKK